MTFHSGAGEGSGLAACSNSAVPCGGVDSLAVSSVGLSGWPRRIPRSSMAGVGVEIVGTPPQTPMLQGDGYRCNNEESVGHVAVAQWRPNRDESQRQLDVAGVTAARSEGRLSAVWTMFRRYGFRDYLPDTGPARADTRSNSSSRRQYGGASLRDQEHNEELFARLNNAREPPRRQVNVARADSEIAPAHLTRRAVAGSRGSGRSSRFLAPQNVGTAMHALERNDGGINFVDMDMPMMWDRDRGRYGADERAGNIERVVDFSNSSTALGNRQLRSNPTDAVLASNSLSSAQGIDYGGIPQSFFHFDVAGEEQALQDAIEQSRMADLLSQLPCEFYNPEQHKDLTECEVCLVDYVSSDELLRLPCMHLFHKACVLPWLRKAHTCPVCQINLCQVIGL